MKKYLCIHCHYYQPPRENPWVEEVVAQESAYPYHDWNERINQECYRANAQSRIQDEEAYVVAVVNNYASISFNFGPTLLSWLEQKDPLTYEGVLAGDRLSREKFGGHGSAIAQAYNHMIMPLANRRDKETQIRWGLADFERRFGRSSEGLWLPETAVDYESLEIAAAHGVKFVILAPHQGKAYRRRGASTPWLTVEHQAIDPSQAYEIPLPAGRSIAAFFYDGPISQAVAFEGLLHNGEVFAQRLLQGYDDKRDNAAQLMHIATDGETYGHHHRHGDMALAYALAHVEDKALAQVINYGQFLALHPPRREAQIHSSSAWSCAHGVERWRSNCGCHSGMHASWQQKWRAPVREAFDTLRDSIAKPYAEKLAPLLSASDEEAPWALRDAYIDLVLERSDEALRAFMHRYCEPRGEPLSAADTELVLRLLEMQRHLLLMYTSCAWFFDDVSGIETVQSLQYAYRAIELAEESLNLELTAAFREKLTTAPSNTKEYKHGGEVFDRLVKPSQVSFLAMGAHFVISSLFAAERSEQTLGSFRVSVLQQERRELGRAKLAFGQAVVASRLTREQKHFLYGAVYFGDHHVNVGAKLIYTTSEYHALAKDLLATFEQADFIGALHTLYHYFDEPLFTIKDLIKDEQQKVIAAILGKNLTEVEDRLLGLYDSSFPLVSYLSGLSVPLPGVFQQIAEFVQNRNLHNALSRPLDEAGLANLQKFLDEAERWGTPLDEQGLSRLFKDCLEGMVSGLDEPRAGGRAKIEQLLEFIGIVRSLNFAIDWGPAQNHFYRWWQSQLQEGLSQGSVPTPTEHQTIAACVRLAEALRVRIHLPNTLL